MIGARWADAEGGGFRRDSHPAYAQGEKEVSVTKASKVQDHAQLVQYWAQQHEKPRPKPGPVSQSAYRYSDNPAHMQDREEVTVTKASKAAIMH